MRWAVAHRRCLLHLDVPGAQQGGCLEKLGLDLICGLALCPGGPPAVDELDFDDVDSGAADLPPQLFVADRVTGCQQIVMDQADASPSGVGDCGDAFRNR